jgi:hypothetical protein
MCQTIRMLATALLMLAVSAQGVAAQTTAEVWRGFAERLALGTELNVRVDDGRRVRATLVGVRDDAVLLQPRTRIPVSIQTVPYEQIVSMELRKPGSGAAKAVAIGVATGVGTFFGILALMFAAVD